MNENNYACVYSHSEDLRMGLAEHYNHLYKESLEKIKSDRYQLDDLIDSPSDNRLGITLIIRPDNTVKKEIQQLLDKIRVIEPQQYFYPNSDIHITVMSIISCYDGFDLSQISIKEYIEVVEESIRGFKSFFIEFRGLTASPSCLMVQGFLLNNTLDKIRDKLRINFKDLDLEQSIDKRYAIQTAHSTIIRLKNKLSNKAGFIRMMEEYKDFYFGTFKVNTIELVYNDWYQRKKNVKTIHQFKLE